LVKRIVDSAISTLPGPANCYIRLTYRAVHGVIDAGLIRNTPMPIQLKRIYDSVAEDDGYRVLVDRIWPRGVAKSDAALDEWCKDLAPSKELRQWFGHDRERWTQFCERYRTELDQHDAGTIEKLRAQARDRKLTLLFAARDTECNNAVVLKAYLEDAQ
jgi:uncharacterized protein YeaO (DUF488 family)